MAPTPQSEGGSAMTVFLDCDGVLADFDAHYEKCVGVRPDPSKPEPPDFWAKLAEHRTFYRDLPVMKDADELVLGVLALGFEPVILTGVPSSITDAPDQKRAWAAAHYPELSVITCFSRHKCSYGRRGDVLIDDRPKYRHLWEEMGGIWITHVSAKQSLESLADVLASRHARRTER